MRFDKTVAVITGGASGIGKAAVEKFVREGAAVAIWDVNDVAGKELELLLLNEGFPARFIHVNTASMHEVQSATEIVVQQFGRIDVLINNAGITRDATLQNMTEDQWQQVLAINLTGVFNGCKCVAPVMIQNRYGRIINTSSIVGLYGNYGQANYAATKGGIIAFTQTLSRELGKHHITVNAVAPGFIATDMIKTIPDKVIEMMTDKVPLRRLGQPEDVANAYAFLASREADFITGTVIRVDGGLTI